MKNEIISELSVTEKEQRIKWIIQPLPEIQADTGIIRQVWINLVSNAIKDLRTINNL